MTNPEFGPTESIHAERVEAERAVSALREALDEVTLNMRILARSSYLDNVDDYLPEEMSKLREAVKASLNLPIQGGIEVNKYFVPARRVYTAARLPYNRYGTSDFQGILRGAGEVPVSMTDNGEAVKALCIAVDPPYLLHNAALSKYYAERGWHDQLRHPFAQKEHQDTTICIPVQTLSERGVQLVDHWKTI